VIQRKFGKSERICGCQLQVGQKMNADFADKALMIADFL
jgi:hypothetical protein